MAAPSLSLAKANSVFNLALFKTLSEKSKTDNIFYSPFSISAALSMLLLGARGNTADELSRVLGFSEGDQPEELPEQQGQPMQMLQQQVQVRMFSSEDQPLMQQTSSLPDCLQQLLPPPFLAPTATADDIHSKFGALLSELNNADGPFSLSVANSLYGEQTFLFLLEFVADLEKYYGAKLETVDFQNNAEGARVKINTWVEEKTQGKIKDLLPENSLSDVTKLVLINAIYFKAKWVKPFKKNDTIDFTFRLNKNDTKQVKMMCQTGFFDSCELPEVNAKALEMPYKDGDLSMIILLPNDIEDDTTGLEKLEKALTHQNLVNWTRPDRMKSDMVDVKIPIFKMAETYDLKDVLQKMGISDAFTSNGDLSGISAAKNLAVSKMVHKAVVEVNEEGTEAAAATAITIELTSAPVNPVSITADHPFLIFIKHKPTKTILFAGRYSSPE
ncbi:leukocyte elastase inhibitor-like [Halichoeres trimaculatus]|uniref:leukocyte elastase inhibitor-like n=1 Tax=Halichoeres trimaculatus TaxID=147232 RepID=UPI003D9E2A56